MASIGIATSQWTTSRMLRQVSYRRQMIFSAEYTSTSAILDLLANYLAKFRASKMEDNEFATDLQAIFELLQILDEFPRGLDVMHDLILFLNEILCHPDNPFLHPALQITSFVIAHSFDVLQSFADSGAATSLIRIFEFPETTSNTKTLVFDVILQIVGHECGATLALDCGLLRLAIESPANAVQLEILCVFVAVQPQEAIAVALDNILQKANHIWRDVTQTGIADGALDCFTCLCTRGFTNRVIATVPFPALISLLYNPHYQTCGPAIARLMTKIVRQNQDLMSLLPFDRFFAILSSISVWGSDGDDVLRLLTEAAQAGKLLDLLTPSAEAVILDLVFDQNWHVRELLL
jgi:hypothetical protein